MARGSKSPFRTPCCVVGAPSCNALWGVGRIWEVSNFGLWIFGATVVTFWAVSMFGSVFVIRDWICFQFSFGVVFCYDFVVAGGWVGVSVGFRGWLWVVLGW